MITDKTINNIFNKVYEIIPYYTDIILLQPVEAVNAHNLFNYYGKYHSISLVI